MSQRSILHAYRHLLRQSLRAVQFSTPARYIVRDQLRLAFRRGDTSEFNTQKVENTLEFLKYATLQNGMEHKILKNLVQAWWYRDGFPVKAPKIVTIQEAEVLVTAYDAFSHNIRMLNENMGMCIPTGNLHVLI
jgi:hypothetical protein